MKKLLLSFGTLLLAAVVCMSLVYQIGSQSHARPDNPIDGVKKNVSERRLTGDNGKGTENPEEKNNRENGANKGTDENKEGKNKEKDSKEKNDGKGTEENDDVNIVDYDENKKDTTKINEYFTTTIRQGETVTVLNYEFAIIQKKHNFRVKAVEVLLNDTLIGNFKGKVRLSEGKNSIAIKVTYLKEDNTSFSATKNYTVYARPGALVINSDLKDNQVVRTKGLTFGAYGSYGGDKLGVKVLVNDKAVEAMASNRYAFSVQLNPGNNRVKIVATCGTHKAEASYNIRYANEKAEIEFITDLRDKKVTSNNFSFEAAARSGGKSVPIFVTCSGSELEPVKNNSYRAILDEGRNIIKLRASDGNKTKTATYTVEYEDPTPGAGEQAKKRPVLVTDLVNGETVTGNMKNFNVWPVDYKGNRIRGNNVSVKCNGKGVEFTWDDSVKTSYKLNLVQGKNNVVIDVQDNEGNSISRTFTLYCYAKQDGEVIGKITISVEASTVGLGYLIPPTETEIHQGENAAEILIDLLTEKGYQYSYSGSIKSNFYLMALKKSGISASAKIPDDLMEHLKEDAEWLSETANGPNALGEYDFSNGSGWMYAVNGDYPNYSLSDCYPQNKYKLRFRFTTFYGCDIGGAGASSGSNTGEGSGNWEKEW